MADDDDPLAEGSAPIWSYFAPDAQRRDAMLALHGTQQELARLEQELPRQVRYARGVGCSWNEIAIALGVSAQAAHKRWARLVAGDDELTEQRPPDDAP